MEGTWQRFTVSGQPCKSGTVCTQNRDVGIWSCPTEGLEGDWDYCCRSGHQCGYSEGFNYPWFVKKTVFLIYIKKFVISTTHKKTFCLVNITKRFDFLNTIKYKHIFKQYGGHTL